MERLLGFDFTKDWDMLLERPSQSEASCIIFFLLCYTFQSLIYHIRRESISRKYGENPSPKESLIKIIDKEVRNKFSALRKTSDYNYDLGIIIWFGTRSITHDTSLKEVF